MDKHKLIRKLKREEYAQTCRMAHEGRRRRCEVLGWRVAAAWHQNMIDKHADEAGMSRARAIEVGMAVPGGGRCSTDQFA